MILDISLFVGFFLVIYISFTLATTYIYKVYAEFNQQSNFVDYKKAFMYFFWALIRTGNPQFVDVKIPVYTNSPLYSDEKIQTTKMDGFCLERVLRNNSNQDWLPFNKLMFRQMCMPHMNYAWHQHASKCFYIINHSSY